MKKSLSLLICLIVSVACWAFDFNNTIFKADLQQPDGRTRSIYFEFNEGGQLTITLKIPGKKIDRTSKASWRQMPYGISYRESNQPEEFLNLAYDSDNAEPYLIILDEYGMDAAHMHQISKDQLLKETSSSPSASKKTTNSRKKKR